jgi:hypothetical protein
VDNAEENTQKKPRFRFEKDCAARKRSGWAILAAFAVQTMHPPQGCPALIGLHNHYYTLNMPMR